MSECFYKAYVALDRIPTLLGRVKKDDLRSGFGCWQEGKQGPQNFRPKAAH
jgi:hypothetical protein